MYKSSMNIPAFKAFLLFLGFLPFLAFLLYKSMSSVRLSVEWLFGDIVNYFRFVDFKKNLKIGLSSVGKMYIVAAILRNALTCMQPNNTSKFFELEPPTVEEYFS